MGRIDQETVQRILDTADIVDVVSDFVKLRRSGANYKGLCPFHNERTPSFSVNKSRNICKCFSCGKGGSPVNFIMLHEQMSFNEALRYLARKYNIEIVERQLSDQEREEASAREALMAVNAYAMEHFKHNLMETEEGRNIALAYFRHRGISEAMIARFHLGYSMEQSTELMDSARGEGFQLEPLLSTGLVGKSERDGSYYDRFRGRVMFPVHTLSGRVVAFGGRIMRQNDKVGKYINSPESPIYSKKREIYGLYQARAAIGKLDQCIMCEGYLDVISMHQAGIENVVASSGTSLTEEQIRTIRRFTRNVVLIYDADAAGVKAAIRGINMLLAENMNVKVVSLPKGDDPDSFAQSHSSSEVERYLRENEVDIIAFLVAKFMEGVDANDPTAKAKVVNDILSTVAYIDEPVARNEYIAQCSRLLNVPENVLLNQLNIFVLRRFEENEKNAKREAARQSIAGIDSEKRENGTETTASPEEKKSTDVPLLNLDANVLKPYEEMIVRYIVRYGLLSAFEYEAEDGSTQQSIVFDVVERELATDSLSLSHPPFARLFDYFSTIRNGAWQEDRQRRIAEVEIECQQELEQRRIQIRNTAESVKEMEKLDAKACEEVAAMRKNLIDEFDMAYGQTRLVNSTEDDIRVVANELLPEKYQLSKIYYRTAVVESEQDQLPMLLMRALTEYRSAIISNMISELTKRLLALDVSDTESIMAIMTELAQWKEMQKELGKVLGERIILPKMR